MTGDRRKKHVDIGKIVGAFAKLRERRRNRRLCRSCGSDDLRGAEREWGEYVDAGAYERFSESGVACGGCGEFEPNGGRR